MAALPVEILLGVYLGLLVGTVPALVAWMLGFVFKYVTDVTLPGFGVTVLAVALAGVNGGLLALADESITANPNAPRIVTAIIVVSMLGLYAHSKGDKMGQTFPKRLSLSGLRAEGLSTEFADFIGNEVRIRVVGEVADMEGYPPLSPELRAELRTTEFTLPADLRLDELEERATDRLEREFDLGDVSVSVDERGRATVVAAPPFSGLSKRVADGRHAVSVTGLIPTGLARGDEVTVITPEAQARGTVVSARSGAAGGTAGTGGSKGSGDPGAGGGDDAPTGDGVAEGVPAPVRAPTTAGGEGRLTVSVTRTDVQPLLRADRAKVVVESRGTRREYEVVSLLRRADRRFRRFTVRPGAGATSAEAVRERYGIVVLAVQKTEGWLVAPGARTPLEEGDELFAAGERERLDDFGAALAPGPAGGGR